MNMNCSRYKSSASIKSLATTTLEPWTRVVSEATLNVAFVESDSMAMTNYIPTAETSTKSAIYVIEEIQGDNSNIMWIMIL